MRRPFFVLSVLLALGLASLGARLTAAETNPAAEGFNLTDSDAQAIAVADQVMAALGGRKAWDNTHFITWRFFGKRLHVWDKFTGNLHYEDDDLIVLMNLNSEVGRAWQAGTEVTDPAALKKLLNKTKGAWINDSYWLLMPYKLKDSGVALKYVGAETDSAGRTCDVLQMTFQDVGRTPDNKYHVFVDQQTHLVTEWTYWKDAAVDDARSLGPWNHWQRYGEILLTADHGKNQHSDIAVFKSLPASVFTNPAPFLLSQY